ncbi:MoaD/ThiS family protein [Candidatus Latescibacterota bacterium]
MVVTIDFIGSQRSLAQTRGIDMPIDGTTRVIDALAYVRGHFPSLPLDEGHLLVTVNQEMTTLDRVLAADDKVAFLPPIAGG